MAELKKFLDGDPIYASDINGNFDAIDEKVTIRANEINKYVEEEVTAIQSSVSSVQATLQENIDNLEAYVNSVNLKTFVGNEIALGKGETDLKEYLPKDEFTYLVWLQVAIKSKSNTEYYVNAGTDLFPIIKVVTTDGDDNRESSAVNVVALPVGVGRKITIENNGGTLQICKLVGYMRA